MKPAIHHLVAVALVFLTCTESLESREEAFIGYSERFGPCADQLDDCLPRSVDNGCLYDAFTMRRFCPSICNIPRCTSEGIRVSSPLDSGLRCLSSGPMRPCGS